MDDGPGRIIGAKVGIDTWDLAVKYFDGSILDEPLELTILTQNGGTCTLSWNAERGLYYKVQGHSGDGSFFDLTPSAQALEDLGTWSDSADGSGFFRVIRTAAP